MPSKEPSKTKLRNARIAAESAALPDQSDGEGSGRGGV